MGTKNALMGPFAGIGDSILMGTYSPILLSIAIGLSAAWFADRRDLLCDRLAGHRHSVKILHVHEGQ